MCACVCVILVVTAEVNGDTESSKSLLCSLYQVKCRKGSYISDNIEYEIRMTCLVFVNYIVVNSCSSLCVVTVDFMCCCVVFTLQMSITVVLYGYRLQGNLMWKLYNVSYATLGCWQQFKSDKRATTIA